MKIKLTAEQKKARPGRGLPVQESMHHELTAKRGKEIGDGFSGCGIPQRQNCAGDIVVLAIRQRTISYELMARCPKYHQWHVPAENLRVTPIIKPLV